LDTEGLVVDSACSFSCLGLASPFVDILSKLGKESSELTEFIQAENPQNFLA
jgi:hypothetical protein